ncbi:MAG: hypothetical protein H0U56_08740 [Methylibium sp.]|nr:hypothetical protein [Methylibium sp.]
MARATQAPRARSRVRFETPLAATIEASGLRLTVELANVHVRRWLDEIANAARVHGTTKAVPAVRLGENAPSCCPPALHAPRALPQHVALPVESLPHPLAVYDELLNDELIGVFA